MRPVAELIEVADPAWPSVSAALVEASGRVRAITIDRTAGEQCLFRIQVSAGSTLGALALHTGGVSVQSGWLRLLGGGGERLPDLATANGLTEPTTASRPPGSLLVGLDVLGGRFAINGGALPGGDGEIHYWAPDTLHWLPLDVGYTAFVHWSLTEAVDEFYADLRWDGWENETSAVNLDEGFSVVPPLCTAESRPIGATSRRAVPLTELHAFHDELAGLPEGPVQFKIVP